MSKEDKVRRKAALDFWATCMVIGRDAKTDPRAAAWFALAYILCASRENHSITYKQAAFDTELETHDLWAAAKERAITNAQMAVEMLERDTPAWHFAKLVLEKAEALDNKLIPKTHSVVKIGGYPASRLHHPAEAALTYAQITRDQFMEFINQIPGHEWLTESDVETSRSSGGKCFIATAALGSPQAKEVVRLRSFRDAFLGQYHLGRAFIKFYETTSPPIAYVIAQSSFARLMTRIFLVRPARWLANFLQGLKKS
jgi:hypothetical protein